MSFFVESKATEFFKKFACSKEISWLRIRISSVTKYNTSIQWIQTSFESCSSSTVKANGSARFNGITGPFLRRSVPPPLGLFSAVSFL